MNRTFLAMFLCALALTAIAAPYLFTATITMPASGGAPDGFNLYLDDCASTGPAGPPQLVVQDGIESAPLELADGTYQVCLRAFNNAGEQPNPGWITPADLFFVGELPGVIQNLTILIQCTGGNVCNIFLSPAVPTS